MVWQEHRMHGALAVVFVAALIGIQTAGCGGAGEKTREGPVRIEETPEEILSWRHRILPRERYEKLAEEWQAYVAAHPEDARAIVEWGDALRYSGRREEARKRYEQAFQVDPGCPAAIAAYTSERLLGDADGTDKALAHERFLQAAEIDAGFADTYYGLWATSLMAEEEERAADCLRKMVALGDMPPPLVDYGYNMLIGAPENAIIFTNGDNDTYPPLAVQALTGMRPDVAIVNLSLLNARWYVRYQRDHGLPIGLDDSAIAALRDEKDQHISAQIQRHLFEQLEGSGWARPLLYSVTVVEGNKVLPGTQVLEGLLGRIVPDGKTDGRCCDLDIERTRFLFDHVYRLDGITDPLVDWEREGSVVMLGRNYVHLLMRLGEEVPSRMAGDGGPYLYRAIKILAFHGAMDEARGVLDQWEGADPGSQLLEEAKHLVRSS